MPVCKVRLVRLAGAVWHRNEHGLVEDNKAWTLIMQVMIRFADGLEFQHLCEHFTGTKGDFVQDFQVATAPGTADRMCIYHIDDGTPLATWIQLRHPNWIDLAWAVKNKSAQHLDPDETFYKLVMEDLNERRANTTP